MLAVRSLQALTVTWHYRFRRSVASPQPTTAGMQFTRPRVTCRPPKSWRTSSPAPSVGDNVTGTLSGRWSLCTNRTGPVPIFWPIARPPRPRQLLLYLPCYWRYTISGACKIIEVPVSAILAPLDVHQAGASGPRSPARTSTSASLRSELLSLDVSRLHQLAGALFSSRRWRKFHLVARPMLRRITAAGAQGLGARRTRSTAPAPPSRPGFR